MDSNMVMVALKADDMAKAKAFAKDPSLKKAMQKGGVTGAPYDFFCYDDLAGYRYISIQISGPGQLFSKRLGCLGKKYLKKVSRKEWIMESPTGHMAMMQTTIKKYRW